MPEKEVRDYAVSQFFAIARGEQPLLVNRRRPPPTPNENTFPRILAQLKALTGFEPPSNIQTPAKPDAAEPPTDAEEGIPEP